MSEINEKNPVVTQQDLTDMDFDNRPPVATDIMLTGSLDSKLDFVATGTSQAMADFLRHYSGGAATIDAPAPEAPTKE